MIAPDQQQLQWQLPHQEQRNLTQLGIGRLAAATLTMWPSLYTGHQKQTEIRVVQMRLWSTEAMASTAR
ncbi:hypothetical protein HaLaN_26439 [Haematococcus lacustris]|uniref:Uncharacterized protein n=1 Tax=Haematococcus lacustris TaxID=44745 RepID=A0A6A0A672_HAELA|nr:hypothetical protein HaLaN_26439 [Haematococcus lacustris]